MGQARKAEGKLESAKKAYADSEKRLKDALFHLAEWKNHAKMLSLPWLALRNRLKRLGLLRRRPKLI